MSRLTAIGFLIQSYRMGFLEIIGVFKLYNEVGGGWEWWQIMCGCGCGGRMDLLVCGLISLLIISKSMSAQAYNDHKQPVWHPNRAYLNLPNSILIDSCFPGGNVAAATLTATTPLTIEIEGNTDINLDTSSKYWLYFRIRGYRKEKPIRFILKNANHLRKYYGQTRYKPYMVYREDDDPWLPNSTPIELTVQENGNFQGSFLFQSQKYCKTNKINKSTNELYPPRDEKTMPSTHNQDSKRGSCYFAIYYPYSYDDLTTFIERHRKKAEDSTNISERAYFNDQTIAYSYQRRKIPLITITSYNNVQSFSEKQPIISEEIFPNSKERPFKLKNNPVLIFSARVHPSETSSSFFVQGLIQFLMSQSKASSILRQMFIIHILPMLNPDGVEHGNFRFDHELRNLNRYYGQSSIQKTPSIRAAELLIDYYKNRNNQQCQFTQFYQETYNRLFLYADIHGHNSALPSFIYGNHSEKVEHLIENKVFCKLLELNSVPGGFSKVQSEFSKKNMTLQQKYDQFSKLCSGRVFAGRADVPQQSVFHSYTFEVLPYWQQFQRRKSDQKVQKLSSPEYAKQLGKNFLISILDMLDINPQSKLSEQQIERIRKNITKQCSNQQLRRNFMARKNQSSAQKINYGELLKTKQNITNQRECYFYSQYIPRWFNNHVFLKHLFSKNQLLKEPKLIRFYQKILKIVPFQANNQILSTISPRKETAKQQRQKDCKSQSPQKHLEKRQMSLINNEKIKSIIQKEERTFSSQEKQIFAIRNKERNKVESKINKQTIQLKQEFRDLIPRHKTIEKDLEFRFGRREFSIKKQPINKQPFDSNQRYQKEVLTKIHTDIRQSNLINPLMQIKRKEIKLKPKSNSRIQTEAINQPFNNSFADVDANLKINPSGSQVGHFYRKQAHTIHNQSNNNVNSYFKPSFIEEFILKIREERESAQQNQNINKPSNRDQLKQKAMKLRPSIKEYVQEQQKKILPMLRRNKIFTIVSETSQIQTQVNKQYDSHFNSKKRALTVQSQDNNQLTRRGKKSYYKKQEVPKEQTCKKINLLGQVKYI